MNKKVSIPSKPRRTGTSIDDWVTGSSEGAENTQNTTQTTKIVTKTQNKKPNNAPTISKTQVKKPEKLKRLTLDIPASLHKKIKTACVAKGESMADVLRGILEEKF